MASYGNGYRQNNGKVRGFCPGAVRARRGPDRRDGTYASGADGALGRLAGALPLLGLGCLVAISGCAATPAVTANGLPRVSRYASPAQLDWMLARYKEVGQSAATEPELREAACLGWERAVFDLESGRRYPVLLRMSADAIALANIWQDLPTLAQRHPRPSSCAAVSPDATAAAQAPSSSSSGGSSASSSAGVAAGLAGGPAAGDAAAAQSETPIQPGLGSGPAGAAAANVARVEGSAQSAAAASAQSRTEAAAGGPSLSAPAALSPPAAPESAVARQRRLLSRLRAVLGMAVQPSVPGGGDAVAASTLRPELAAGLRPELTYEISDAALAELTELAQSDLAAIRLRARFHLLGLCTLAVEADDRYLIDSPALSRPSLPSLTKACGTLPPGKSLRHGQRRLLWSLLATWRIKYSDPLEPMSDIVIALASFAARDNPVVDGPRGSR